MTIWHHTYGAKNNYNMNKLASNALEITQNKDSKRNGWLQSKSVDKDPLEMQKFKYLKMAEKLLKF